MMDVFWSFTPPIKPFVFFSPIHWIALSLIAVLAVVIIFILAKRKNSGLNRGFELISVFLLACNEIVYVIWIASFQDFNWAYHLPLHLCDTALLLLIIQLLLPQKSQILYEILYFAGVGGAIQALLTPVVGRLGFPHFVCLTFFHLHGFLVVIPLYLTIVRGMRISFKSLVRFILIMNGFLLFVMFINWIIQFLPPSFEKGNYLFLTDPPSTGSLVDFLVDIFGASPNYILGLEILGLVVCFVLYAPFWIYETVKKKNAA